MPDVLLLFGNVRLVERHGNCRERDHLPAGVGHLDVVVIAIRHIRG